MRISSLQSLVAVVLSLSIASNAVCKDPPAEEDARLFDFAQPIAGITPSEMRCVVDASLGRVRVKLVIPDVELEPRLGTNLPPENVRGDWDLLIEPVPAYSSSDAMRIKSMTSQQRFSRVDLTRYIKIGDAYFEVDYPGYRPADEKNRAIIERFVKRLSEKSTMLDGSKSEEYLKRVIMDP